MRNKVIATRRQNYGGEWFNASQEITTKTERDADDLVALGLAKWNGDGHEKRYKRRDMRAEH